MTKKQLLLSVGTDAGVRADIGAVPGIKTRALPSARNRTVGNDRKGSKAPIRTASIIVIATTEGPPPAQFMLASYRALPRSARRKFGGIDLLSPCARC